MQFIIVLSSLYGVAAHATKQSVHALYLPLADHYAAIVAYEQYRNVMSHANFTIQKMKNWDLLKAYFLSGEVDMAFVMAPLAMKMYQQKANFHWIGLMHRDGSAFAINNYFNQLLPLSPNKQLRKPNSELAHRILELYQQYKKPLTVAVPHLYSTHTVVLYRYLLEHGIEFSIQPNGLNPVQVITVAPAKSPIFLKSQSNRARPAAFEQGLPWADIVETQNFGKVAWYSKDVMPYAYGHIDCITLANNKSINNKFAALKEVMFYIQKAGLDIENARHQGGKALQTIISLILKHIPSHTEAAIAASLNNKLQVINYKKLNIDKGGLQQIMKYSLAAGLLHKPINIDEFADERFVENNEVKLIKTPDTLTKH